MRRFKVTVDGEQFEVEVEEVSGPTVRSATPAVATAVASRPARQAQAPQPAPVHKPAPAGPQPAGNNVVRAPLPGTVVAIRVEPGQTVLTGQAVCVLEAMKMENEIPSPISGVVRQVLVAKGETVTANQGLCVIE